MKDITVFTYLNSINSSKRDFLLEPSCEENIRFSKEYSPMVINTFLSGSIDTLMLANEMNISGLDAKKQFTFLINTVIRKKRFTRWIKPAKDKDIDVLSKHYNISRKKASQYLKMHSPDQIKKLHDKYNELDALSKGK